MRFLALMNTCFMLVLAISTNSFAQEDTITKDTITGASASQVPDVTVPYVDIAIWGGPIYTGEEEQYIVEAIAITGNRFSHIGSKFEIEQLVGPDTKVIDLDGRTIYPGFTDSHAHLGGIGERELSLNLDSVKSINDLQTALKTWIETHLGEQSQVIVGRGWIETHWPENRFPSRWDLDHVAPDIPVILTRADGHALVANSAAIMAAGITKETEAPFGGKIERNIIGEATGIFIDEAMGLFASIQPTASSERRDEALIKGAEVYASRGWTGLHNMSVSLEDAIRLESLSAEEAVAIRVYNSVNQSDAETLIDSGMRTSDDGRIITRGIKLYVDGALGSRGAALLAPYDDADTSGLITLKEEDARVLMQNALSSGIQINTHAIGDRGNRLVLNWISDALTMVPAQSRALVDPRWRIEHAQIIDPVDIPRFKELNIIPSMQPSHAIGDLHFAPDRLGDERLIGAYAWRQLIDSGVIIAGGSDAPVEVGSPLIEFYAAISRHDLTGYQGENWNPSEVVTREEALKMFTLWPAVASFREDELGTIKVGKMADISGFDTDIMTAEPADILNAKAILTIVDGKILFDQTGS